MSICLPWAGAPVVLPISTVNTPLANFAETALWSASAGKVKLRVKLP